MKNINFNINTKQALLLTKVLAVIGIAVLLSYVGYFLYKNFYQIMIESEELVKSQKNLAGETINMKKFNDIVKILEKKGGAKNGGQINNPFD